MDCTGTTAETSESASSAVKPVENVLTNANSTRKRRPLRTKAGGSSKKGVGLVVVSSSSEDEPELPLSKRRKKEKARIKAIQCNWVGCGKSFGSKDEITQHLHDVHLHDVDIG